MKNFIILTVVMLILAGCKTEQPKVVAGKTPGGITYSRIYIPNAKTISIQVAWPSTWAFRDHVNQAVPYIGADLILSGGAEGFPAGQAGEIFADLRAEGRIWVTANHVYGQLNVPIENVKRAIEIANAHLLKPTMNESWFKRIQESFADNMRETKSKPVNQGYDALRWAILGDTSLRRALSIDPIDLISSATQDEVLKWHQSTITRSDAKIVISGELNSDDADKLVDMLMAGLPEKPVEHVAHLSVNFKSRRILLHVPESQISSLIFIGPLPPTRDGNEAEDYLINSELGGDDKSILFNALRTELRATYNFASSIDAYTRDLRVLVMSGEIETSKLAEAETIIRKAYSEFQNSPRIIDLPARKIPFKSMGEQTAKDPAEAAFSALMWILDGQDPANALKLASLFDAITDDAIKVRTSRAFPALDDFVVLAVSADAQALPGACVISSPHEARDCP